MTDHNQTDEELSTIDLVVVLIRYRKLIIIPTVLLTVAVFAVASFFPMVFPSETTVSASAIFKPVPSIVSSELFFSWSSNIGEYMRNTEFIATVMEKFNNEYPEAKQWDTMNNDIIRNLLDNEIQYVVTGNSLDIHYAFLSVDDRREFVGAIVDTLENELLGYIAQQNEQFQAKTSATIREIEEVLNAYDFSLDRSVDAPSVQQLLTLIARREAVSNFVSSLDGSIWREEPFILTSSERVNVVLATVLTFFASLIFFVFLAFIVNYISILKGDPSVMDKLRKARKVSRTAQ